MADDVTQVACETINDIRDVVTFKQKLDENHGGLNRVHGTLRSPDMLHWISPDLPEFKPIKAKTGRPKA